MSRLKQAVKMLRYNFSSIAFFEIVYRVLSLAILTPAMYGLLNVSTDIAGVSYLSSGTIYRYMRSPVTYVTFLLILIPILDSGLSSSFSRRFKESSGTTPVTIV